MSHLLAIKANYRFNMFLLYLHLLFLLLSFLAPAVRRQVSLLPTVKASDARFRCRIQLESPAHLNTFKCRGKRTVNGYPLAQRCPQVLEVSWLPQVLPAMFMSAMILATMSKSLASFMVVDPSLTILIERESMWKHRFYLSLPFPAIPTEKIFSPSTIGVSPKHSQAVIA